MHWPTYFHIVMLIASINVRFNISLTGSCRRWSWQRVRRFEVRFESCWGGRKPFYLEWKVFKIVLLKAKKNLKSLKIWNYWNNGSSYHFLPVATGLTSNVENLMTGEWLNFPEEAAPIPGPAVDVWNFKTYLSSCFWRSIMQSSRRTTCNSIVRILRVSPIFIVNIPSYINRCSVKFKF